MKKIRLLTLLVLGLLIGGTAYAQSRVSGVVKSSEDGQPLAGVVVQIKGTNIAVLSAGDGAYTINNPAVANATLVFNFAGMRKQEVPVAGKSTVNVTLQPDALQAEAVTVTAMGGKKQDRKVGYATTTVKGDELSRTNNINPINALQGKVAGVNIASNGSAGVTSTPVITIRGAKSLTKNNSPIFVIDGIVMQNDEAGLASGAGSNVYGNQLKNLNSDDFESVTVLKGAAATSLYGSRGANGAIVITTKGGKARKGVGVEVNYTHEFQQTYQAPYKLQNIYGEGSPANGYEGDVIPGQNYTNKNYIRYSFGPAMNTGLELQQHYKLGKYNDPVEPYVSYPDNWKALFQTGQYDNIGVALTGGSDKATYRVSYSFTDSKGTMPNNDFKRHSVNVRTNGQINDVFSVDFSMQYTNSTAQNAMNQQFWGNNLAQMTTYKLNRSTDLEWYRDHYINDDWTRISTGGIQDLSDLQGILNQIVDNNEERNEQTIIGSLGITGQFNDWLDARAQISFNDYTTFNEVKNYGAGYARAGGRYATSGSGSGSYNALVSLHSNNRFIDDNLELDVRVFSETYGGTRGSSWSKETNGGLIVPGLFTFGNSSNPLTISNYQSNFNRRNDMTVGVGGAINLSWKDQINLEVTGRNDWVSTLTYPTWLPAGQNNFSVFYPSVNLSWIFSDTFHINPDVLSFGKLRASFAQVGSGTSVYETAKGAGGFNVGSQLAPDGSSVKYASPNNGTLPNLDLKPEIQQSMEFGADLRFLNGAIGLDVAYYKTNTKNQIMQIGTVSESGVTQQLINAGNIQNQGWEFQLDFRPIQTNTVRWDMSFNWTRNRGKVIELHAGYTQYKLWNEGDACPGIYAFEGGAFGQVVGGAGYGQNGYARDANGKPYIINSGLWGGTQTYDYVAGGSISGYYNDEHPYDEFGNIEPDFLFGFNTNVNVNLPNNNGSLDFFAQIDGRSGGSVISPAYREASTNGSLEESLYGRDAEHGGELRTNYKGEQVYNGMVLDGVFYDDGARVGENGQLIEGGSVVKDLRTGQLINIGGMTMREAVDQGIIQPMLAAAHYPWSLGWGCPSDSFVQDMSYVALREITLGYNFPEKWIKHVGLQSARLSFSARNLCYIYNGLGGGANPESITINNPLTPIDTGGVPFTRNFAFTLNLKF